MSVKELIEILSKYPPDALVIVEDNEWGYSSIDKTNIEMVEGDELHRNIDTDAKQAVVIDTDVKY